MFRLFLFQIRYCLDYVQKFLDRSVLTARELKPKKPKEKFLGITTIALNKEIVKELLYDEHFITCDVDHGVLVWKVMDGTIAKRYEALINKNRYFFVSFLLEVACCLETS